VIFQPKNPNISTTRYSLIIGEVTRKENAIPKGIPASRKLKNMGIEEHEQKGVNAPKRAANKFPKPPVLFNHPLILCWDKNVLKKPMAEIIMRSKRIIFIES
jgi:hypothetical protein